MRFNHGKAQIKGIGRRKVVITTTGKSKMRKQLKETEREEWFHGMLTEAGRADALALAPKLRNKAFKENLATEVKGDQGEYYYRRAYGINVHGKNREGTALYSGAEAERAGNKLNKEYIDFLAKREKERAEQNKRGETEYVTEDSDSYGSSASSFKRKADMRRVKYAALDPVRENLKFKSMAKYRALMDGEVHMYTDIENGMLDLALCKGLACDDTSVEESEREIEERLKKERLERLDDDDG